MRQYAVGSCRTDCRATSCCRSCSSAEFSPTSHGIAMLCTQNHVPQAAVSAAALGANATQQARASSGVQDRPCSHPPLSGSRQPCSHNAGQLAWGTVARILAAGLGWWHGDVQCRKVQQGHVEAKRLCHAASGDCSRCQCGCGCCQPWHDCRAADHGSCTGRHRIRPGRSR